MHRELWLVGLLLAAGLAGCLGGEELDPQREDASGENASAEPNGTDGVRNVSDPFADPNRTSNGTANATAGDAASGTANQSGDAGEPDPVRFRPPVRVGAQRDHYEPSVEAGPEGVAYVTAPTFSPDASSGRYASDLWYSPDGREFSRLPSPASVHERLPGLEGSIALDDENRLYFVDLLVADNTFSRWSAGPDPSWETTRPLQGTAATLDDRPWVAAHGDGIVYYLANTGINPVTPRPADADPHPGDGIWIHTSTDAGRTFGPGHSFSDSVWCSPAPSKAEVGTVHVACLAGDRAEETLAVDLHASTDTGQTWQTQRLADDKRASPLEIGYPAAAADASGAVHVAWADDNVQDERPGRLRVASGVPDAGLDVQTLVPFEGAVENPWLSAAGDGRVALTFHGSPDVQAGEDSPWYPYLLVTDDARAANATWRLVQLSAEPVGEGETPPQDFFQNALGPDGRVHVVYHDESGDGPRVLYTRQVSGPGLDAGEPSP